MDKNSAITLIVLINAACITVAVLYALATFVAAFFQVSLGTAGVLLLIFIAIIVQTIAR